MPYYTDVGSRGDSILGFETPAVLAVLEAPNPSTPVVLSCPVSGSPAILMINDGQLTQKSPS
jgi:hypothetical protein